MLGSFLENNRPNEILQQAAEKQIKTFAIPMANAVDLRALFHLIRLLRREKIDLLCVHHYKAVVLGILAGTWLKIPVLDYSRGFTAENKKIAFYESLERYFLRWIDGIITVSAGQLNLLHSYGIKPANMWVVHNGVQVDIRQISGPNIKKELNLPGNTLLAAAVGRLSPEKGHTYLIEALSCLASDIRIVILFCGDGVESVKLQAQARELGLSEKCRFLGFVKNINEIYQGIDFLVLPSLTEGMPNVVLEAFAFSKPVVATAVGGVPEVVSDGINGFLVPKENSAQLAAAIEKLSRDAQLRLKMGEAGQRAVQEQFSFENQTGKLIKIYNLFLKD
jgi:glycosyltransferase involved in cell wall biosynthesis